MIDQAHFPNPENFLPDRFIQQNGSFSMILKSAAFLLDFEVVLENSSRLPTIFIFQLKLSKISKLKKFTEIFNRQDIHRYFRQRNSKFGSYKENKRFLLILIFYYFFLIF